MGPIADCEAHLSVIREKAARDPDSQAVLSEDKQEPYEMKTGHTSVHSSEDRAYIGPQQ